MFEKENILENVNKVSVYLKEKLEKLAEKYDMICSVRGLGLMQAVELTVPVAPYINKALEKGLLILSAGANTIRFVPPLVISEENVDDMIAILDECFKG